MNTMKLLRVVTFFTTLGVVASQSETIPPALLLPSDTSVDFNIQPPALPTSFDTATSKTNKLVGTFKYDVEGLENQGDLFKLRLSQCAGGDGDFTPTGKDLALDTQVTLTNPSSAFSEEVWCIKAQLTFPNGAGTVAVLAELNYKITLTVPTEGGFTIDSTQSSINLPPATIEDPVTANVNEGAPISIDGFISAGTVAGLSSGSNIVLGTSVTVQVSRDTGGNVPSDYKYKILNVTAAQSSDAAENDRINLQSSVGTSFVDTAESTFGSTNIPLEFYTTSPGTVVLFVAISWELTGRRLRALQDGPEEFTKGAFESTLLVDLSMPSESGAFNIVSLTNVGASVAALGATALLV